jgi:protein ImuB
MPMSKLYACIVPDPGVANAPRLTALAEQFSYRIEAAEDGVLFDVSGLENRIGPPGAVAQSILSEMRSRGIAGNLAVAANAQAALVYARGRRGVTVIEGEVQGPDLPLEALGIEPDTLGIFRKLGFRTAGDLKRVPADELVARYGLEFRRTIDLINQNGVHILTPDLRKSAVAWEYQLDFPVADLERLVFILGHGLGKVLEETRRYGFSSEQIDISLGLEDRTSADQSIKLSFPTLDQKFWLKLMTLRLGNHPPACEIVSVRLVCHFARPRAIERGLFSATRPEPESLLLTVDKIKNLVGAENAGVPVLLDQRLAEAFVLDAGKLPLGRESKEQRTGRPVVALSLFHPPLLASVRTSEGRLVHLSTKYFSGRVTEYGGAWRESSAWWSRAGWQRTQWDVELESRKVYRLALAGREWWVTGGYD